MTNTMVSPSEFIKQVWDVEHVRLGLDREWFERVILVPSYPYTEPISDDATVDELLQTRIQPCLNMAVTWKSTVWFLS